MKQTLFWIPHEWIPWPLLWAWLALVAVWLVVSGWRRGSKIALKELVPTAVIVGLLIFFVLPYLETADINPDDPTGPLVVRGLAVRGYGVFLAAGILAAIGLIIRRARRSGFAVDVLLSLCFWIVIGGLLSARLFYVLQKWSEFSIKSPLDFVKAMGDMTRGGLVVYGSFLGAIAVTVIFVRRRGLALWPTLDVLAPAMTLGLCIGRIGCLMNGCCFGGACDPNFIAGVQFPPGSPPYMRQLERGILLGLSGEWAPDSRYSLDVRFVQPGSLADQLGIRAGDRVSAPIFSDLLLHGIHENRVSGEFVIHWPIQSGQQATQLTLSTADLPPYSLKVHPAQIYAAITAGLLTILLWLAYDHRRFAGQVFCLLLILYGIGRFLEESIRDDEGGWLGTPLTISQWLSILGVLAGFALWIILVRSPLPIPNSPANCRFHSPPEWKP